MPNGPNGQPVPVDVRALPKWLQAAVFLGVPSVIALFLVYFLTVQTANRIAEIEKLIGLQQTTLVQLQNAQIARQSDASLMKEHFDRMVGSLVKAVRQLCVAVADTPEERTGCFRETSEH